MNRCDDRSFPSAIRRDIVDIDDSAAVPGSISGTYPGMDGRGVEDFESSVLIPRLRT